VILLLLIFRRTLGLNDIHTLDDLESKSYCGKKARKMVGQF
jgi:hypothetical protein